MKIMKQTVKTIVNIALDSADFANLIEKYKRSDAYKASFPNAFKDMSVTAEMPEENVIRVMKEIFSRGNADTYNFIAKALGFDGWENAGYLDNEKMILMLFSNGVRIIE